MHEIKTGVIPAAGQGTRMGYLSEILPKALFPIYDKPIIHRVIENMKVIGVEQVHVIVHYQKDRIMEYLRSAQDEIGIGIDFVEQPELSGIADAVMLTRGFINEPFIIILGDDCTITESLHNIAACFHENDATLVEGIVVEDNSNVLRSTCCLSLGEGGKIVEITEKPKNPPSNLRGCGIYICKPGVFEYIERTPVSSIRGEIEITQTIGIIARAGNAYGEFINGINVNINSHRDLLEAWLLAREWQTNSASLSQVRENWRGGAHEPLHEFSSPLK